MKLFYFVPIILFLSTITFYFARRALHYRRIRVLADAISFCVQSRGRGAILDIIRRQVGVVFDVQTDIVHVVYQGGQSVTIEFTAPLRRPRLKIQAVTNQLGAFMPTWATFKLLTTEEDIARDLSPADKRRAELLKAFEELGKKV